MLLFIFCGLVAHSSMKMLFSSTSRMVLSSTISTPIWMCPLVGFMTEHGRRASVALPSFQPMRWVMVSL
jgi:hypothetical protein